MKKYILPPERRSYIYDKYYEQTNSYLQVEVPLNADNHILSVCHNEKYNHIFKDVYGVEFSNTVNDFKDFTKSITKVDTQNIILYLYEDSGVGLWVKEEDDSFIRETINNFNLNDIKSVSVGYVIGTHSPMFEDSSLMSAEPIRGYMINMHVELKGKQKIVSGIDLIAEERMEQLTKHNRSIEDDVKFNTNYQLSYAASLLALEELFINKMTCPLNWDNELWKKMNNKTHKERLIIAGALIAAEIDRLNYIENNEVRL